MVTSWHAVGSRKLRIHIPHPQETGSEKCKWGKASLHSKSSTTCPDSLGTEGSSTEAYEG